MYKVEITAASLEELADKALALGGRLALTAVRGANKPQPEPAQAGSVLAVVDKASQLLEDVAARALQSKKAAEAVTVAADPEPVAPPIPDYVTEVAPAVLKYVEAKGKPAAAALLQSYGVDRARNIDPTLWAEFLARINSELAQ
jgi:hypothetical protein